MHSLNSGREIIAVPFCSIVALSNLTGLPQDELMGRFPELNQGTYHVHLYNALTRLGLKLRTPKINYINKTVFALGSVTQPMLVGITGHWVVAMHGKLYDYKYPKGETPAKTEYSRMKINFAVEVWENAR